MSDLKVRYIPGYSCHIVEKDYETIARFFGKCSGKSARAFKEGYEKAAALSPEGDNDG